MPRLPDAVTVRLSNGQDVEWAVLNPATCRDNVALGRKGCGARIFWCRTHKGKLMPVDEEPDEHGKHQAHWSTCQTADTFRGSKTAAEDGRDRAAQVDS